MGELNKKLDAINPDIEKKKTIIINNSDDTEDFSKIRQTLDKDSECRKFCGKTYQEIINDIQNLYNQTIREQLVKIPEDDRAQVQSDIELVFNSFISQLCRFTLNETNMVFNKIIKRLEQILTEFPDFYQKSNKEKADIFNNRICQYIPTQQMEWYSDLLISERIGPFVFYKDIVDKINAQDFILSSTFINIQYNNNGSFILITLPEYLHGINSVLINHVAENFVRYYNSKNESSKIKFGISRRDVEEFSEILDIEYEGLRFNFAHGSIKTDKNAGLFIRKNIQKSQKHIDLNEYYINLLSDFNLTDAEINEVIKKCQKYETENLLENKKYNKFDNPNVNNWKEYVIHILKNYIIYQNGLVVGQTGSGKTTFLSNTLKTAPQEQNLLTIEDTPELFIPNAFSYFTREGAVSTKDIFTRAVLRQNPSKVVVGEARTDVIVDILEIGLATRFDTTLHAKTFPKLIARIHRMAPNINANELDMLIASSVDIIIFMDARKITSVYIRNDIEYEDKINECYTRIL